MFSRKVNVEIRMKWEIAALRSKYLQQLSFSLFSGVWTEDLRQPRHNCVWHFCQGTSLATSTLMFWSLTLIFTISLILHVQVPQIVWSVRLAEKRKTAADLIFFYIYSKWEWIQKYIQSDNCTSVNITSYKTCHNPSQ